MKEDNVTILKVSSQSDVKKVAGSIAKCLEEGKKVEIVTIGAASLNQAVKACAKARGFVASKGYDLIVKPGFGETFIDGESKTCIRLVVMYQ